MKLVDSQALERVAKALRLSGATSGETDFDDEHLQQTLDVSRLLVGEGVEDGWVWLTASIPLEEIAWTSGFITVQQVLNVLEPDPGIEQNLRVWLMQAAITFEPFSGTADLSRAASSVRFPSFPSNPSGIFRGIVAWSGFTNGDDFQIAMNGATPVVPGLHSTVNVPPWLRLPIPLPRGAQIDLAALMTALGGGGAMNPSFTRHHFLFWVGPRGLNPPGVA